MGLTLVELLINISPMKISYSKNVIAYGYTDTASARHPLEGCFFAPNYLSY